jgi:hypothetical protein
MASVLETLLLPHRLGVAALTAIPRIVDALERIDRRLDKIDELPRHIEGLQSAFDRANDEIEALRHAIKPELAEMADDLETVGRLAGRIPGNRSKD